MLAEPLRSWIRTAFRAEKVQPVSFLRSQFLSESHFGVTSSRAFLPLRCSRGRICGQGWLGMQCWSGSGVELSDRLSTPLATELPAPGIEVHAQILDGILTGRLLHEVPVGFGVVLLAITCLAVVVAFRKWRGWASISLVVGLAIAVYAIAFLTFLWASRILPAGPMLLAVIAGPVLVYGADFALVERSLTRQLLGLRAWLTKQGQDAGPPGNSDLSWKLALLHKLETELGSLYELHQTLLESTQDLVAIFDEEGRLLLKNQAFEAALAPTGSAVTLEQLRTRWIAEPDAPVIRASAGQEGEVYLNGTPTRSELCHYRQLGSRLGGGR